MRKITTVVIAVGALALVLAGCRPGGDVVAPSPEPVATDEQTPAAPAFSVPSLKDDGDISLSDFKGKVVLVDFWATWCGPCRYEIPSLKRLHSELGEKGLAIVGMTVDRGSREQVAGLVKGFDLPYPVGLAGQQVQSEFGGIRAVPTKFLIDRSGRVQKHYEGVVREAELRADIEALL